MTTHVLKPLAIALLLGIAPLSISTAYAAAAVAGPAGPTGATGAKGATGLQGPAGANGTNGSNGAQGIQGLTGLAGTNGTNGTKGATGAPGLTGPSGGVKGVKGDQGASGAPGATGAPGTPKIVHFIGESYAGGIVIWVDAAGEHGLIAARADQSPGVQWYNGTDKLTGTTGDGLYAGAMNTALIVAQQTGDTAGGNFAAKVAADYSVQADGKTACTGAATEICHSDWYLPSTFELTLLYQQKVAIGVGGFTNDNYWSSTENDSSSAWN